MSNIEKIRQEIERMLTFDGSIATSYYIGKRDAERELKSFIDSLPEDEPSKDLLDAAKDALLLERAWLTLDNFGHEELAERLREFAERKGLIWK